jgi:hypothetical protein
MPSRSRAERLNGFLDLLPPAATVVAEGCWVGVVYAALEVGLGGAAQPPLGLWFFVAAGAAGLGVGRRSSSGHGVRIVAALAVATLGIAGWLADPRVTVALARGDVGSALAAHGPGWLLGVAAGRGTAHRDRNDDDVVVASLLGIGVPGLAVPWLIGGSSVGRSAFFATALPETLLFVGAGLVAVGVTRLDALGRATDADWRANRTWLGLLGGVVALIVVVGIPAAALLGVSIEAVLGVVLGPAAILIDAVVRAAGSILGAVAGLVGFLVPGLAFPGGTGPNPVGPPPGASTAILIAVGIAMVAGLAFLLHPDRGRPRRVAPPAPRSEERSIRLPRIELSLPIIHLPQLRFRRPMPPRTASEAYLDLLAGIAASPSARRLSESPAAHAGRLRGGGAGSLALDLLAADFELERYAKRTLSPNEVRRALARWRVARRIT